MIDDNSGRDFFFIGYSILFYPILNELGINKYFPMIFRSIGKLWGHHGVTMAVRCYAHWMCGEPSGDFVQPSLGESPTKVGIPGSDLLEVR